MRISRFLLLVNFFTALSLLYVWQQTEVFRLAYTGQKSLAQYQDLLDTNTILMYTIEKKVSLTQLGNKISEDRDFQMPGTYRLVKSAYPKGLLAQTLPAPKQESLAARIFGIKRQAEAKVVSPSEH